MGRKLARRSNWSVLTKEGTFTSAATETQDTLPADFDRMVNDSMFDRTQSRQIIGPRSPQNWTRDKSYVSVGVWSYFRIRGKSIIFEPTPSAGNSIYYEYISTYWVDTGADGLGDATSFAADTNTSVLDETVLTLGVIWRLLKAKGLDYSEEFREYEHQLDLLVARDGAKPKLRLSGPAVFSLGEPNIPETGFG